MGEDAKLEAHGGAVGDYFGFSVAMSGGVDDNDGIDSGSACFFAINCTQWVHISKLVANDGTEDGLFGMNVAKSVEAI